jgi:hypothetical protein
VFYYHCPSKPQVYYICIQSLNLIESREFRDLLLFLRETLNDQDIPHRSKLRSLIIEEWVEYWDDLKTELKVHIFAIHLHVQNLTSFSSSLHSVGCVSLRTCGAVLECTHTLQ